jgi:hypothetical protein
MRFCRSAGEINLDGRADPIIIHPEDLADYLLERVHAPSAIVNDNVLYHSLSGLASPQQVSASLAGDEDYSLKWMAAAKCAQWHS